MSSIRSLSILASFAALPLAAQEPRDSTRQPQAIAPTVVTATRETGVIRSQTATVTVLDGEALRAQGLTHLDDALRRVPGAAIVRTSSFGSQTSLFMRGGQSNYLRLLIDGVPVNEPGGVLDFGRITLDGVERIEVVRGPASVLYGSEAVTGVIQLFTQRAADAPKVNALIGGGSNDARRASLGFGDARERFGWRLQGDHHRSQGVLAFNNAYQNDGLTASVDLVPDEQFTLRLTGRYLGAVYHYPTESDGTVADHNAERTEHTVYWGADGGVRWGDRAETRLQFTSSELHPRTSDGADDAGDTLGFYGYYARATVTRRMTDLRTSVRVVGTHRIALGGEYARDEEHSTSVSQSEFGDFPGEFRAERTNRALYAQGLGDLGAVSYTIGGRVDDNSAFGTFRTLRLGLAWRAASRVVVRASAGSAFKAPSFFENFATGFTVGNPALEPERTRSAELGVETALAGTTLRVTGFTQRFVDMIQYTGAVPFGEPNYYNVAKANAGGIEAEVGLPVVVGIVSSLAHTWTDTRVLDAGFNSAPSDNFVQGGKLLRRPEHLTTLSLSRSLAGRGTLSATVIRTGEREDRDFSNFPADVVFLDPVTTIDLGAQLRVPAAWFEGASLQLRADNLTNVGYEAVAGYRAPGRTLFMGLNLQR